MIWKGKIFSLLPIATHIESSIAPTRISHVSFSFKLHSFSLRENIENAKNKKRSKNNDFCDERKFRKLPLVAIS